ncbi:MAG: DJ-1/PfpI family protein [Candidatus Cloacimonetes bacterium]|nr:DJ-1/PfpI family protein [Candidatus Cloacimonadota bacterium]
MRKKVLVPVANGSEDIEIVGIVDTLRRAGAEVTIASVQGLQITASRGLKITADRKLTDCLGEKYDLIALPGGMPGAEYLRDSEPLTRLLREQAKSNRLYAAICASPVVVLQHHGLLRGKKATVHPALTDKLIDADLIADRVVVDGNCITSRGPGTVLEFAVTLIELLFGKQMAEKVSNPMLIR